MTTKLALLTLALLSASAFAAPAGALTNDKNRVVGYTSETPTVQATPAAKTEAKPVAKASTKSEAKPAALTGPTVRTLNDKNRTLTY